jgi:hypothetical protein
MKLCSHESQINPSFQICEACMWNNRYETCGWRERTLRKSKSSFVCSHTVLNKGNNKITELRTILQRESQNS